MKHCWFCLQRLVDKAVMVTKADLMEPQDKFHRAGAGTKRGGGGEEDAPFTPNLESIREDSCESRPSSEDEHSRYVAGRGQHTGDGNGYQAGRDGYQAGREGRCTGRVDESRPSSEDEHSRYVAGWR